ncbi:MAG: substrate-binding domain-containing protein, partial [Bdellovibrionales bacterium]|nr:substrate-binding domain-containing protein [Bdellovibrionales bacterium]
MRRVTRSFALAAACGALLVAAPRAEARDQIQIVGSSTVYPFSTVVAEKLSQKRMLKAPVVESTGTGGGMKLFCSGVGEQFPDITNASRPMKDSEWEMCQKNGVKDIVEVIIGNDGIVFANGGEGPKNLHFTVAQLWQALAAKGPKPERWNQIDPSLPNQPIRVMVPPPTSGTRDAWSELVMAEGCDAKVKAANKDDCQLLREDGAVVEAGENDTLIVQKLAADPQAFGIFGFSYFDGNRDKLHAARINGVQVSLDTIQSYEYPVARPLFFYVKKAHIGAIPGIDAYMKEFTSNAAAGDDGYLAEVGLVPLAPKKLADMRDAVSEMKTIR